MMALEKFTVDLVIVVTQSVEAAGGHCLPTVSVRHPDADESVDLYSTRYCRMTL